MKSICLITPLMLLGTGFLLVLNLERREPRPEEIVGSWVGYEHGCVFFYYLVLEQGGTGSCQMLFAAGDADSYRVKWHIKSDKLVLAIVPVDRTAENMKIKVESFDLLSMDLSVKGVAGNWNRKATLYKENELNAKIQKCRDLHRGFQPKKARAP